MKVFTHVEILKEILVIMDQGTNFTSQLMKELCELLKVKVLRLLAYHPQTNGLVEYFNKTLNSMLQKFTDTKPCDWYQLFPPLWFAICKVPQVLTGLSPFELLFGHQP